MELATLLGLIVGLGGILLGNAMEGGHLESLMQLTAAIIVLGGTIGAVLVGTPMRDVKTGIQLVGLAFFESSREKHTKLIKDLVNAAQLARKESLLSLESKISGFSHPFMRDVFRLVVDGTDVAVLRSVFETTIQQEEERLNAGSKIWTDAGGFAPTIGIIGAVLGLIHVMSNLTDTSKLGAGIAVAFVATIYGVGLANLFFLPIGNKIKRKIRSEMEIKEMILEAAIDVSSGLNPFIIEQKLKSFSH